MNIKFTGKYKSITAFEWLNIPKFAVITGPNGTGKSQLLELIYNTIINDRQEKERVTIENETIEGHEISLIQGEWQLSRTNGTTLNNILIQKQNYFNQFQKMNKQSNYDWKLQKAFSDILEKFNKPLYQISKQEFDKEIEGMIVQNEVQLSQKMEEIFYTYRLNEMQLRDKLLKQYSAKEVRKNKDYETIFEEIEKEIINEIGQKPWIVLRDILKTSKLPFSFNDPSEHDIKDSFHLQVQNTITGDCINFSDLSSGEKVLISLVFYLYNTQEKNVFPKLLLLDEPDAHLHPRMSQQLLDVIKDVLVEKYNVRVMMTTHSPSTVALTDEDSLFEMSRTNPRIQKSPSKNHTISLLTSGLVYVGQGTRYFLVEDEDDVKFYSYLYDYLTSEKIINGDIPFVFIPASTKDKTGGKSVVEGWVKKLQDSGLQQIIQGIIDNDQGNETSEGMYKIKRYCFENYLIDPIVTYAALMDNEKHTDYFDCELKLGEEYKLKFLDKDILQKIADEIFNKIEPKLLELKQDSKLNDLFGDYNPDQETIKEPIKFTNEITLQYPKWITKRSGKVILNRVYTQVFEPGGKVINFNNLDKAFRKINFISNDIVDLFNEIR
ncbi:MAG: AAA family ATPase [Crocosphaera sp.]|nr:AAA family ATPase [Crocosphaera sp.]